MPLDDAKARLGEAEVSRLTEGCRRIGAEAGLSEEIFCTRLLAELSPTMPRRQAGRIFSAFKGPGAGPLSVGELLVGVAVVRAGSPAERLAMAFHGASSGAAFLSPAVLEAALLEDHALGASGGGGGAPPNVTAAGASLFPAAGGAVGLATFVAWGQTGRGRADAEAWGLFDWMVALDQAFASTGRSSAAAAAATAPSLAAGGISGASDLAVSSQDFGLLKELFTRCQVRFLATGARQRHVWGEGKQKEYMPTASECLVSLCVTHGRPHLVPGQPLRYHGAGPERFGGRRPPRPHSSLWEEPPRRGGQRARASGGGHCRDTAAANQ